MGIPALTQPKVLIKPSANGYDSKYPDGGDPDPEPEPGLTLLFEENFETGTLAEKTWITHNSGNLNYAAIVETDIGNVLRQNLNNSLSPNADPITGKLCDGNQTHTFLASNYYDPAINNHILYEMEFRLDDSLWNTSANDPYPVIAGKMFLPDVDVGILGPYLGLTNSSTIRIVAQNGTFDWNNWTSRPYGWKTAGGEPSNGIYLTCANKLFQSDGVLRKFSFEIMYNPDGIGYHKGRIFADGLPCVDLAGINTDEDGWFNLPIEYEFRGTRIYAAGLDINIWEDHDTRPDDYDGYAGGFNVKRYAIYSVGAAQ